MMPLMSEKKERNIKPRTILMKDIVYEGDDRLHEVCKPVELPINDEDTSILLSLLAYVINSQDEEFVNKYNVRPAVGLAAPQIGVLKRMFAIVCYDEEDKLHILPLVNPKILEHSEEKVYLNGGEGCISVKRPTSGLTPRYKWIKIEALKWNVKRKEFEKIREKIDGYLSIVFQHEYDHLDGILYVDKMYNKLPDCKPVMEEIEEGENEDK